MKVHVFNPLEDPRWHAFASRHPQASVFHQRGWIQALARTYGYEPCVLTSAQPGQPLSDGIVFCRVSSWLTGTRLVSLPFADHCQPLTNDLSQTSAFVHWLNSECDRQSWKYVELRPLTGLDAVPGLQLSRSYYFHELDLKPSLEQIFHRLHKDSIQRKIRRAETRGLSYEVGSSPLLESDFYRLLLTTRRRHQLFPQPRNWFKNLRECMGDAFQIRILRKENTPIAAILTLRHGSTVVYKYGCSDERFHNLGSMPFLFWRLIEEAKAGSFENIDFGRSDLDQNSLVRFKDKFGAGKRLLSYYRYLNVEQAKERMNPLNWGGVRSIFSLMPDAVLATGGKLLYRHMG